MNKIKLFDIEIDNLTMNETINIILNSIKNGEFIVREDLNAAKMIWLNKHKELFDAIKNAEIINADGQSVVLASKFLGNPLKERITGIDLMENLVNVAPKEKLKIFFFGSKEESVKGVVDKYSQMYGSEIIAGYRNGYYKKEEENVIVQQIAKSGADILFVGMGSPAKEIFIDSYRKELNTPFIMGVGGSFDVIAGKVTRAPLWMQRYGLEWFYRFLQEPRRMWKRYLHTNTMFIYLVLKEKFFGKL